MKIQMEERKTDDVHKSSGVITPDQLAAFRVDRKFPQRLGAPGLTKSQQDSRLARKQAAAKVAKQFNDLAAENTSDKPEVSYGTGDDLRKGARKIRRAHRHGEALSKGDFLRGRY